MPEIFGHDYKAQLREASQLSDPLSEVTRKQRRAVLIVALVQFAIVFGDLLPTKITTLGIDLSANNLSRLLLILFGLQAFLLFEFWVYATADLRAWAIEKERIFTESSEEQAARRTNLAPNEGQDEEQFSYWLADKRQEFAKLFHAELERHFKILKTRVFLERWIAVIISASALVTTLVKALLLGVT
jgi:hypothetical protein